MLLAWTQGDPRKVIYPTDSRGQFCGQAGTPQEWVIVSNISSLSNQKCPIAHYRSDLSLNDFERSTLSFSTVFCELHTVFSGQPEPVQSVWREHFIRNIFSGTLYISAYFDENMLLEIALSPRWKNKVLSLMKFVAPFLSKHAHGTYCGGKRNYWISTFFLINVLWIL